MRHQRMLRLLGRYTAEVLIIFTGITISFIFDQWRQDKADQHARKDFLRSIITDLNAKRSEIQSDNPSAEMWINRLDSIQAGRTTGQVAGKHLIWFHSIMLTGGKFFFNSSTPTFTGAIGTPVWQGLPDSTKRHLYHVFMEDMEFNHIAYKQLSESMNEFRNSEMTTSGILRLDLNEKSTEADLKTFAQEISRPPYGSIIQAIMDGEKFLLKRGNATVTDIDQLIRELEQVIAATE